MTKNETKKKTSTVKSPLQIVKQRYGEKKNLVSELAGKIERREGESKADAEKRLSRVPSKKLLALLKRVEEAEKLGGRKAIIDAIHDRTVKARAKKDNPKEDSALKKGLDKKTLGELLDKNRSMARKAKKAK